MGSLSGAALGRKGREGKGLGNSGIFGRSCNGARAGVRVEARAKVDISHGYSKIGNKSINNVYNGCAFFCAVFYIINGIFMEFILHYLFH
jgi:hypothetical protein